MVELLVKGGYYRDVDECKTVHPVSQSIVRECIGTVTTPTHFIETKLNFFILNRATIYTAKVLYLQLRKQLLLWTLIHLNKLEECVKMWHVTLA